MNAKLPLVAIAAVGIALWLWRPWAVDQPASPGTTPEVSAVEPVRAEVDTPAASAPDERVAASQAAEPEASLDSRQCTIVGRIVLPGGAGASGGRFRLDGPWNTGPQPQAIANENGEFALGVQLQGKGYLPFSIALADAPGWAVREQELPHDIEKRIVAGKLDLGTFELESGIAIRGQVLEASGIPLTSRCLLRSWDATNLRSSPSLSFSRTIGFADVGGRMHVEELVAAPPGGVAMLMAIGSTGIGWTELAISKGRTQLDPVTIQLLPGGAVEVLVVDQDGQPLEGVDVHATPHLHPIGLSPMWDEGYEDRPPNLPEVAALLLRRTNAAGRARFDHLPRRNHPQIQEANRNQQIKPAALLGAHLAGYLPARASIDPGQDAVAAVTMTLRRRPRLTISGVVTTPNHEPVAGLKVTDGLGGASTTDELGKYALAEREFDASSAFLSVIGEEVPLVQAEVALPAGQDHVEHNFVVERRAPVRGQVVDQDGQPVPGTRIHLGVPRKGYFDSVPDVTGDDGRFEFPNALPSHTDLWVEPPAPATAWLVHPNRPILSRENEIITLHRETSPLVSLKIEIIDGRSNAPVSATAARILPSGDLRTHSWRPVEVERLHGAITARALLPGDYVLWVEAGDELSAERRLAIAAWPESQTETLALWPPTTVTGTVDMSDLPADLQESYRDKTVLGTLDAQHERSYAVDERGERLKLTPNTILVRLGTAPAFRLENVTPNVSRRLIIHNDELFGEVWFVAKPDAVTDVALRVTTRGRVHFQRTGGWPAGIVHWDRHDGSGWRTASRRHDPKYPGVEVLDAPPGPLRWRVRMQTLADRQVIEHSGETTVVAGGVTEVWVE